MELVAISMGAQIGYTTGDPLNLLDDLAVLRPHFFPAVPRVLNRIYQAAMSAGSQPGIKGALFRRAVATKINNLRANNQFTHPFYDRLVFRKASRVATRAVRNIALMFCCYSCTTCSVDGCGCSQPALPRLAPTSWSSLRSACCARFSKVWF